MVNFLCSDIDKCGHTAVEVIQGVGIAFERIKRLVPGVMCISSEGDAGGGGSVQSTFDDFIKEGTLEAFARFINCLMHALTKCLQRPSEAVFGKQGMGQNSCLQMIYSIVKVYKRIREEGGIEMADAIQALVVQKLVDDGNMQMELERSCLQGLETFMDAINGDDIEEVLGYFLSPRDMQEPVWTRWMTTVRAAIMVVDNWAQIYVTMIIVKSSKKSSSHLAKTATDALALMKTKADKEDNTPLFYAQLLFLKAFSESFYNNAHDMAM